MFSPTTKTTNTTKGARLRVHRRAPRGIATIETAVTLPLLVFLTFGAIEIANLIFLRQTLAIASYEGAKAVCNTAGTEAAATQRVSDVMTSRGCANYNIAFSPSGASIARGTLVQVTVSTPRSSLSYAPFQVFTGSSISNSTTMVHQ